MRIMLQLYLECFQEPHTFQQCCTDLHSHHSVGEFPFLHPLQCLIFIDFLNSDWCEAVPRCSFELHLSNS